MLIVVDNEVSLRMFNQKDSSEFYNLIIDSKSFLKEWLGWLDNMKDEEDAAQFIQLKGKELLINNGYPQSFVILYNDRIAGTIGFNEIDQTNKVGDVGYWLGKDFQGMGIISKAFIELINYGFKELKLSKIEVRVAVENKKSRALPEKFGFKEEGKIRQAERLYDHYVDHVIYGLRENEWEQNKV